MPVKRTVKREYAPVPECFRGDAPEDPWRQIKAREQRAREAMVAVEEVKILAERVRDCYEREGVNHERNCQEIVREYVGRISRPTLRSGPVEMTDVKLQD